MGRVTYIAIASAIFPALIASTLAVSAQAMTVSRTITVDGNLSDWVGVYDNPDQFTVDAQGTVDPADRDYKVQATGRDLARFSFTFDADNLYFYIERYASAKNKNEWWFYLDMNADGLMSDNEPIFNAQWQGNNGKVVRTLWRYVAAAPGGDPLVDPVTGFADGYDMPGRNVNPTSLDGNQAVPGGGASGTQMESWISWSSLGVPGPSSLGFHIASSNSTNLPQQLDDNMDGPYGGTLWFLDLVLDKAASPTSALSGEAVAYEITVSNASPLEATNITITDDLAAVGLTYLNDDSASSGTTYDPATGEWQIPLLAGGTTSTLTIEATANVASELTLSNVATLIDLDQIDVSPANNSAQAAVTFSPAPALTFTKSVSTFSDPTGAAWPKNIPGALIDYTIEVVNSGSGAAENVLIEDRLPAEVALYVGDLGTGAGPVEFVDGSGADASGLDYVFDSLPSTTDDLAFSANAGADNFTYVPTPDASGFDGNVTDVRITPSGMLDPATTGTPRARFRLRVRLR